jgi:hypothetical protein
VDPSTHKLKIQINNTGTIHESTQVFNPIADLTNALLLGVFGNTSNGWFDGKIGPTSIWKGGLLGSTDVDQIYNSGSTRTKYADVAPSTVPVIAIPTFVDADDTEVNVSRGTATGGVAPYTYQWQDSDAADGTWADLSGETGTTLAYDAANFTSGVWRWLRVEVVDSSGTPQTVHSAALPVRLWGVPMVWGFVGDSITDSGNNSWAPNFITKLPKYLHHRQVSLGASCNRGAAGTTSAIWEVDTGSILTNSITAFNSASVTDVAILGWSNDATAGGGSPTAPSTVASLTASICSQLFSGVSTLERIWIFGPPYISEWTPAGFTESFWAGVEQALLDQWDALIGICNGTTILNSAPYLDFEHFAWHPSETLEGEHPTTTGADNMGEFHAAGVAAKLLNPSSGGGASANMRGGFVN